MQGGADDSGRHDFQGELSAVRMHCIESVGRVKAEVSHLGDAIAWRAGLVGVLTGHVVEGKVERGCAPGVAAHRLGDDCDAIAPEREVDRHADARLIRIVRLDLNGKTDHAGLYFQKPVHHRHRRSCRRVGGRIVVGVDSRSQQQASAANGSLYRSFAVVGGRLRLGKRPRSRQRKISQRRHCTLARRRCCGLSESGKDQRNDQQDGQELNQRGPKEHNTSNAT